MTLQTGLNLRAVLLIGLPIAIVIALWVIAPGYRRHDGDLAAGPRSGGSSQELQPRLDGADQRNAVRIGDLSTLRSLLIEYDGQFGAIPSTTGRLQTLCTYEGLDAGCALKAIRADLPADPLGRNSGYWYASDGSVFILVAQWEGPREPPADYACPAAITALVRKATCISGQP